MKDWITCPNCEEEFKIIADNLLEVLYCPFCSEDIPEDWSDLDDSEEE